MKTIPIALAAEYAASGSTLCVCLKVTRADSVVVGFTSSNAPLTVSGVLYEPGFEPSDIVSTSGLEVGNLELTVLPDTPGGLAVDRTDLIDGLWDGAEFEIFECNWKAPADGVNILKRGTMGEVRALRGSFAIEMRGLKQALQQYLGKVTSKTCDARLGDANCRGIDLADWTFTYPITAVDPTEPTRRFTCAAAVEASDFYGDGIARSDAGPNAGHSRKIKSFAGGVFVLQLGFPFELTVTDELIVTAGCRKRLDEDCKTKFDNVLNFYGEPHLPGPDLLTADPQVDAP